MNHLCMIVGSSCYGIKHIKEAVILMKAVLI